MHKQYLVDLKPPTMPPYRDHMSCNTMYHGSGYRTIDASLNLKPYSTISCNVTVMHEQNAVVFVET